MNWALLYDPEKGTILSALRDLPNRGRPFLAAYSPNTPPRTLSDDCVKRRCVPALLKDKFIMWNRQIIEGGCNEHVWVYCCRYSQHPQMEASVVSLIAYCFLMGPLSLLMRFRCHALHAAYGCAQGSILSPLLWLNSIYFGIWTISKDKTCLKCV